MNGGEASLKCVITWSDRRNLCSIVEDTLQAKIVADDITRIGDDAFVAYTASGPAEIRDWVRDALDSGESVVVMEFERWSGYGPGLDSAWLLRRGH